MTVSEAPALAGGRTYRCAGCGYPITLYADDAVPGCPVCGARRFEPASIFLDTTESDVWTPARPSAPDWMDELHAAAPALAMNGPDRPRLVPLPPGFTRIGRGFGADVRLDDPTVSRRHALISRNGDEVTVLDDHSLNGVFVNGDRVDFRHLGDGDEIELGGFQMYFVSPDAA